MAERYDPHEAEPRWQEYWRKNKIYVFDPKSKAEAYTVDTPPPTVSGRMHLGHSFSYAHEDYVVRYQRMRGKADVKWRTDDLMGLLRGDD